MIIHQKPTTEILAGYLADAYVNSSKEQKKHSCFGVTNDLCTAVVFDKTADPEKTKTFIVFKVSGLTLEYKHDQEDIVFSQKQAKEIFKSNIVDFCKQNPAAKRNEMNTQQTQKVTFEITKTSKTKYNFDIMIDGDVVLTGEKKTLDLIVWLVEDTMKHIND